MSKQGSTKSKKRRGIRTGFPGDRHGSYTIVCEAEAVRTKRMVRVRCDCGAERVFQVAALRSGNCGACKACAPPLTKDRPEYGIWGGMKYRCGNPNHRLYPRYGGRGITVCERWRDSFEAFIDDVGERPSADHSIGRIDNDGNYEPSNVRWETRLEQNRNKSTTRRLTFKGETLRYDEWSTRVGLSAELIASRIRCGWSINRTLTQPPSGRGELHGSARLKAAGVRAIRAGLAAGVSQQVLAETHGVSDSTISRIHMGVSWSEVA